MSIRPVFLGALLALTLLAPSAFADMGRVYISTQGVTVGEAAQKAIILHNEREEVLILGTELSASKRTPVIRFIPFPSEPEVRLAPKDVFERLATVVAKYKLEYVSVFHSKAGKDAVNTADVEIRLSTKLGAHDITVLKVRDAAAFRTWVNDYFRHNGLPHSKIYPKEEAVVADYVARGIDYFVLDVVEIPDSSRFIDPIEYRFKSTSLYYPLKTSNTFGGKGEIELFIVSPTTLCVPGSAIFMEEGDKAIDARGHAAGDCLKLTAKASTSVQMVREEHDLQTIYPEAETFFGSKPVFFQSIRYVGPYAFKDDVIVPLPQGMPRAFPAPRTEEDNLFHLVMGEAPAMCRSKPDRGPCKGAIESYYFDGKSCKAFLWGGCQGEVPFQTKAECEETCLPKLPSGK